LLSTPFLSPATELDFSCIPEAPFPSSIVLPMGVFERDIWLPFFPFSALLKKFLPPSSIIFVILSIRLRSSV
jgi:hypothetical protein